MIPMTSTIKLEDVLRSNLIKHFGEDYDQEKLSIQEFRLGGAFFQSFSYDNGEVAFTFKYHSEKISETECEMIMEIFEGEAARDIVDKTLAEIHEKIKNRKAESGESDEKN